MNRSGRRHDCYGDIWRLVSQLFPGDDAILLDMRVQEATNQYENSDSSVLTVDQAHGLIGKDKISRSSFYTAIQRGEFPSRRLGKRILIPRVALTKWLGGGVS
jgi:excisionase family DNA binding protein